MTPTGQAQAGALVANGWDNGAVTVNPAAGAMAQRFDAHAHFAAGEQTELSATAVDASAQSSKLVLGVGFRRTTWEPPYTDDDLPGWYSGEFPSNVKRQTELQAGASYPFLDRKFSLGVGGTVSYYANDRQGKGWSGNVDVGVAGRPQDWLVLGLVGRNLVPIEQTRDMPLGALGGVRIEKPEVGGIELDGGFEVHDGAFVPDLRLGGEFGVDIVRIAGGFSYTGAPVIHGGIGFVNENGGLRYAIRAPLDGTPIQHTVGIVLFTKPVLRP